MTLTQACILGIIHGLTQFLPVSASAHLEFVPRFLHWQQPNIAFQVFLHLGAVVASFGYFARDWWGILKGGIASIIERRIGFDRDRLHFWLIFLATIPALAVTTLFGHEVEATFQASAVLIAIPLALGGFFLYWIDGKYAALRTFEELNAKDAFFIGLAQAISVIPGVSRTGASITMARLMGLSRDGSARFAYLLALPVLLAGSLAKWRTLAEQVGVTIQFPPLIAGMLCTTFFGILAIHLVLRLVRETDYAIFAWYRILLAAGVILWTVYRG